jgi:gluconokinase
LVGADFLEGDHFHPARNVSLMASGVPLTDDDRRDWLLTIAKHLAEARAARRGLVASCSALKRSYRDLLRTASPDLAFVHLDGDAALLQARMSARTDHFMPPSLLASQLLTLEPPGPDERALILDAALPADQNASLAATWLASLSDASASDASTSKAGTS